MWYRPTHLDVNSRKFWHQFCHQSYHVIIWLFPFDVSADEMRTQVEKVSYDLLRLWHYRHKVIWAYYQSRYQKSILKREYVEIQPAIQQTQELPKLFQRNDLKLSKLQKTLTDNLVNLSDYTIALNFLENQNRTIIVNLDNYKFRLEEMERKYPGSDLSCLKIFNESEVFAQKYQRQLEADYATLSPGLTLLQNLNSTVQGIIDLEQTKSDRSLDTTIALAGTGLAVSGIIATAISAKQPPVKEFNDITFFYSPIFMWSILFSSPFLVALVVRLFYRLLRSRL